MKRFILVLLACCVMLILLAACGNTPDKEGTKPSTQNEAVSGTPKILKIEFSVHDDGTEYSVVDSYEYDEDHFIQGYTRTIDGVLMRQYTFDGSIDRPLSIREGWIDENNEVRWDNKEFTYQYDDQGRVVEYTDQNKNRVINSYDNEGNLICENYGDSYCDYIYEKNLCTQMICYRDGKAYYRDIYEYNESGKRTAMFSYYDGELSYSQMWEYDSKGNVVAEGRQDKNYPEHSHSSTFEYSENGLLMLEKHYSYNEEMVAEVVYEYNARGDMISQTFIEYGEERRRNQYSYDSEGKSVLLECFYQGERFISAQIEFERVAVSEELANELASVLINWTDEIGGFDYYWNW